MKKYSVEEKKKTGEKDDEGLPFYDSFSFFRGTS